MKRLLILALAVSCIAAFERPAMAGKGGKGKNKGVKPPGAGVFKRFDLNKDHTLDAAEKEALVATFKAGDTDLKVLDTNADGKLDENEIAAIPHGKRAKGGKGGKKNKQ